MGEATRIQMGNDGLDFGLFKVEGNKGSGLETLASQMVGIAVDGIANQIR